jgi:hypothetical protein
MKPVSFHEQAVPSDLKNCLYASGAALVLHGNRDLVDCDLAQLRNLSEQQRAAITVVVVSDTGITGACFRHLAALPNLRALYANKTRIDDEAPFERLPKTLGVVNLDHTEVGDRCVSKLKTAPSLYSIRLRNTNITPLGVDMLASMPGLRDCEIHGTDVNEHTRQRLLNAIVLREVTCYAAFDVLLRYSQLAAAKLLFVLRDVPFARYFRCGAWWKRTYQIA